MLINADLRSIYQQINIPILHILGELDSIIPCSVAKQLKILNLNTNIKTINAAGHIPFITHSETFINHLTDFIKQWKLK